MGKVSTPTKKHPAVGCCGIDCALCPRHHTNGTSRCPGCAGPDFFEEHPSCSILTCCLAAKGREACSDCDAFPCDRIAHWDRADSFVTHRNCLSNLRTIREKGWAAFVAQQKERLKLLESMLERYDDGRSKSFSCLSAALLPLWELEKTMAWMRDRDTPPDDRKRRANALREAFVSAARGNNIELSYRKARERERFELRRQAVAGDGLRE